MHVVIRGQHGSSAFWLRSQGGAQEIPARPLTSLRRSAIDHQHRQTIQNIDHQHPFVVGWQRIRGDAHRHPIGAGDGETERQARLARRIGS